MDHLGHASSVTMPEILQETLGRVLSLRMWVRQGSSSPVAIFGLAMWSRTKTCSGWRSTKRMASSSWRSKMRMS